MGDMSDGKGFDARIAFAAARARTGVPRPVGASWGGWGAVACPRGTQRGQRTGMDPAADAADDVPSPQAFGGE